LYFDLILCFRWQFIGWRYQNNCFINVMHAKIYGNWRIVQ